MASAAGLAGGSAGILACPRSSADHARPRPDSSRHTTDQMSRCMGQAKESESPQMSRVGLDMGYQRTYRLLPCHTVLGSVLGSRVIVLGSELRAEGTLLLQPLLRLLQQTHTRHLAAPVVHLHCQPSHMRCEARIQIPVTRLERRGLAGGQSSEDGGCVPVPWCWRACRAAARPC